MKKARSFKLSNSESKGVRKENSRFNMLSVDLSAAVTPQRKSSPGRVSDGSSPNYMKPTSSSDARKEGLQVNPKSQIHDTSRSPKGLSFSKSPTSGQKPVTLLRINSSLRPIRPSMKKSSGIALYPKLNVGQATCSSTLKDSKFPTYVELSSGGTELEGASVMKVCPYTYCSLNGHLHEPSPPLKRFLSAKRRLLKAQKSMKLRGISAPKMEDPTEGKEIDTGQMEFNGAMTVDVDSAGSVIHLIEDDDTDFFIEIYAKPKEENRESRQNSEPFKVSDDPEKVMFIGDDEISYRFRECSGTEEGGSQNENDDLNSRKTSEPDFDYHDISGFLTENLKCNGRLQGLNVGEAEAESLCDCESSSDGEFPPEESDSEASNMDWEQKISYSSDDEGFDSSAPSVDGFIPKVNPFPVDEDYETTDGAALFENDADDELIFPESTIGDSVSHNDANLDVGQLSVGIELSSTYGDEASVEVTAKQQEETVDKKNEVHERGNIILPEHHPLDDLEELTHTDDTVSESHVDTEEEEEEEEDDDDDDSLKGDSQWDESLYVVSEFSEVTEDDNDSLKSDSQSDLVRSAENQRIAQDEVDVEENAQELEDLCGLDHTHPETGGTEEEGFEVEDLSDEALQLAASKTKQSYKRSNRRLTEVPNAVKDLNLRPPRFLPIEPDPEAEKVDLRHQMMEERKNSEEWMIDYALRQTLNKLAPAGKKRVALVVEAFETVMPIPKWEAAHLRGSAAGFPHIRHIQACS